MSETVTESYIGSGIVYVNGRDVGNASDVSFAIEQDTQELPNNRGGGGNYDEVTRISSMSFSATLNDFSNENLALALRGVVSVAASETVTDEEQVAILGGLTVTNKVIDTEQPVTVTDDSGSTTYDLDTDYTVSSAGIRILSGGAITDGEDLQISYKSKAGNVLEALVDSGKEVKVVIDGVNDASGKPWVIKIHRWKPTPTSELNVIGEGFASFPIEGGVLADPNVVGNNKSKFFQRFAA